MDPKIKLMVVLKRATRKIIDFNIFLFHKGYSQLLKSPLKNLLLRSAFINNSKISKYQIYSTINESFVLISKDYTISQEVYVNGEFGLSTFIKAKNILGPEFKIKDFIDIGANIGTISIPVVRRGYSLNAYCFEPSPENFNVLKANIYLNDLSNHIKAFNIALGSEKNQSLVFELSDENSGDHRVRVSEEDGVYKEQNRKTISVKSECLDDMLPNFFDKNATLIWIDTQGYEGFVLKGAQKFLKHQIPLVVEFWPYGLERAGSVDDFKQSCFNYSYYYDLSLPVPSKMDLNPSTFDKLYANYKNTEGTDILFI
jgi:FkbM family methyltransferase